MIGVGVESRGPGDVASVVEIVVGNGQISLHSAIGTDEHFNEGTTYEPNAHRWLRLEESDDTVRALTSSDGMIWEELRSTPLLFPQEWVSVYLALDNAMDNPGADEARFDNLNAR